MDQTATSRFLLQEALFWSKKFKLLDVQTDGNRSNQEEALRLINTAKRHPFLMRDLKYPVRKSQAIESLLHDFRAHGGLLPKRPFSATGMAKVGNQSTDDDEAAADQQIAVLMCAYSNSSSLSFCIDPSVIEMEFYGQNDNTLGAYLEKYCFKPAAACSHPQCSAPQVEHIRKFCHGSGSLTITLKKLKQADQIEAAQTNIINWSFCQQCKSSSPYVVLATDTWSMSFAKYLQLKISVPSYCHCSGGAGDSSHRNIFQYHFHYFAHKEIVAIFRYSPVRVSDLALLGRIQIRPEPLDLSALKDELRENTVRIFEHLSQVLDRLCTLKAEVNAGHQEEMIQDFMAGEVTERNHFRERIEYLQVELISHPDPVRRLQIQDGLILLAKACSDSHLLWSQRINDFVAAKRKEEKAAPKGSTSSALQQPIQSRQTSTASMSDYDTQSNASGPSLISRQSSAINMEVAANGSLAQLESSGLSTDLSIPDVGSVFLSSSERYDSDPDRTPFASVELGPEEVNLDVEVNPAEATEVQLKQNHNQVFVNAIEALDQLVIQDSYEQPTGRDQEQNQITRTSSDSSLSSETGEDTPIVESIAQGLSNSTLRPESESETQSTTNEQVIDSTDGPRKSAPTQAAKPPTAKESKTMKAIFNQLLSAPSTFELEAPFPSSDHYNIPLRERLPIVMHDDDPGSQIAYGLTSSDYERRLLELHGATPLSPHIGMSTGGDSIILPTPGIDPGQLTPLTASFQGSDKPEQSSAPKSEHIDIQFQDQTTKFYFCAYFAEQFRRLRSILIDVQHATKTTPSNPDDEEEDELITAKEPPVTTTAQSNPFLFSYNQSEEMYIRSLGKCVPWKARGGKSGSKFCKTANDRFVLKEMSKTEYQSFLNLARSYFEYLENCHVEKRPSLLAKILGVYKVGHKNTATNSSQKMYLLVMENVFYNRSSMVNIYDLKGSERNRFATVKTQENVVLLDENLMERIRDEPFYIRPHSKNVLRQAYESDSLFLSSNQIMDYSMLVGLDTDREEYACGIIDYVRSFTFDKKLEMAWKLLISQNKTKPTIMAPEYYRERFCKKMDIYFLTVPDS